MKMIALCIMTCCVCPILLSQGTYTASVITDDIYWQNQNEWNGLFHAVLYLNGDSIASSGFTHYWYTRENGVGNFQPYTTGGFALSNHQDQEANQYYEMYVRIDVPAYGLVQSNTVMLSKYGDPENVGFLPVKEDETPMSLFEVNVLHWTGYRWINDFQVMSNGEFVKIRYNGSLGEKFLRGEHSPQGDIRYMNYDSYPVYYGPGGTHVQNDFIFRHKRQYNASVNSQLIDNPLGGYAGEFKDAWLEDYLGVGGEFKSQGLQAPFKSVTFDPQNPWNLGINTVYKGVFINENPLFDASRPNYLVKALFSKSVDGFTWYRQSLSATNASFQNSAAEETRINFTAANATVTATYKAHRGSSLSTATTSNGQQKLWSDYTASTMDLIYPSAGEIWWTRYNSGGSVIVPEKRISSGTGNCGYPSLVKTGSKIYAVWQRYNSGTNQYQIQYAKYDGTNWTSPVNIATTTYDASYDPAPVISVTPASGGVIYDHLEVVWRQSPTGLANVYSDFSGSSWSSQASFTGSGLLRPSLATSLTYYHDGYGPMNTIALATDDNYYIYLRQVDFFVSGGGGGGPESSGSTLRKTAAPGYWGNAQVVPGSYSYYGSTKKAHATHSTYNSRVYLVWQAYTGSHTINFVSKYLPNGSWSSVYSISMTYSTDFSPVVSALSNGDAVIATNDCYSACAVPVTSVFQWYYSSGQFYYKPGQTYAQHPQASTSESSPSVARFVTTSTTGLPYQVGNSIPPVPGIALKEQVINRSAGDDDNTGMFLEVFGRKITAYDTVTHDYAELELTLPTVKAHARNLPVSFMSINDTMPQWDRTNPWAMLSTQEIDLPTDAESLTVGISFFSQRNSALKKRLSLKLIDSNTKTELATLGSFESKAQLTENRLAAKVNLQLVRGRKVKLEVNGLASAEDSTVVYSVNHLLRLPSSNAGAAAQGSEVVFVEPTIPQSSLLQNYPNPFNPETKIEYLLKEPAHVKLVVYDMLGREVAELINSEQREGFHTVSWNASRASTGIYFYHLIVTPNEGKRFSQTKKMLLTR